MEDLLKYQDEVSNTRAANASFEMVVILVMCNPILLESLELVGGHATWAVGLVVIPLGQPGGDLKGETCEVALAL